MTQLWRIENDASFFYLLPRNNTKPRKTIGCVMIVSG